MKTVYLKVDEEVVDGAGKVVGAKGTTSTDILVEFSPDWETLSKYATTRDAKGLHPEVIVLTELMKEPIGEEEENRFAYRFTLSGNATCEEGLMSITFTGYEVENGNENETVTNTALAKLRVLPSDYMMMDDASVTPTIAQQLQGEIDEIKDDIAIATHAQEYAEAAELSAAAASLSAGAADNSATEAESYAHGNTGSRTGEDTDNAKYYSEQSDESAQDSASSAVLSESWAVGGTGEREGEDTNNAKYWAEQAQGAVTGVTSFNSRTGDVVPASGDYDITDISNNGTLGQVPMSDGQGGFTMGTPSTVGDLDDLGDVDISTPSNGQVLGYNSTSQKWENTNASGGGHTIKDPSGASATQRANLQFVDAKVTDDSVNGATKIEVVREITAVDFTSETEDGLYDVTGENDEFFTAEDIEYRTGTTVKQELDRAESNAATVENGSTSANPYTAGAHIMRNGKYYRVKASIAVGDSFVVGTNIEEKKYGDEISEVTSNLSFVTPTFNFSDTAGRGTLSITSVKKQLNNYYITFDFVNGSTALSPGLTFADVHLTDITAMSVVGSGAAGSTASIAVYLTGTRFALKVIGNTLGANENITTSVILTEDV